MTCFHPITAYKSRAADLTLAPQQYYKTKKILFRPIENREKIEIPCGHCLGCRLDHASMWATRITMEAKQWKKCCFVTLTYNNETKEDGSPKNLPIKNGKMTLKKKDLQDFLKRLRYYHEGEEQWENPKNGKIEKPIRYFACGEYGDKNGRPHYHIALFNFEPKDLKLYRTNRHNNPIFKSKELKKIWGKGFIVVEELNFETASYIARYVQKKAGLKPQKRKYTGEFEQEWRTDERNGEPYLHTINKFKKQKKEIEEEFIVMSRAVGIGRTYWEENKEKIKRNKGVLLKVKDRVQLKPIPRYFKKLWEQENWEEFYRYKYEKQKETIKKKIEIISRISLPDGTAEEIKWDFYLKKQEEILKTKAERLKRDEFV